MGKFGIFCSYIHIESTEEILKSKVDKLNKEVLSLQIRNIELQIKLQNINAQTNIDMSLEILIKSNSWFFCEQCDYKTRDKKGLKIHEGKMHGQFENRRILQISKIYRDYYYCSDCETTYKT